MMVVSLFVDVHVMFLENTTLSAPFAGNPNPW
jgi:hypothetical protein